MKGFSLAAISSLGFHGILAYALLRAPLAMFATQEPDSITFEIEPVSEPVDVEMEPPPPEPPPPEEVLPEEIEPPPPAAMEVQPPDPQPPEPQSPSTLEPGPVDPQESGPTPGPGRIDTPEVAPDHLPRDLSPEEQRRLIDPRNAATSWYVPTGPGPTRRGPAAGLGSIRRAPAVTEAELEAEHSGFLRGQAMTKNHTVREPFTLRRRPDGTHVHVNARITCVVHTDGHMSFEEPDAVQTEGFSTSGTFDLNDMLQQANGQDPLRAERERCMEETESLRHRLETAHRRAENAGGLRRLRGLLARTWAMTRRSSEARRRRLFDLWDDMDEDDYGNEARRLLIEFIRETIPSGSDDAYTDTEISRFNSSRESRDRFAPY